MNTPCYSGPPSNPLLNKRLGIAIEPKPGSKEVHCSKCAQLMWIGPNIIAAHEKEPLPFVCYMCALIAGMSPDSVVSLGPGGHNYSSKDSSGK